MSREEDVYNLHSVSLEIDTQSQEMQKLSMLFAYNVKGQC